MSRKCRVAITRQAPAERLVAECEIQDLDWDVLWRFVQYAEELRTAQILQRKPPWNLELHSDGRGNVTQHNLPPRIEVRELIHMLRPFVLESEDTYFYKVLSLLGKYFQPQGFRDYFAQWRARYSGKDQHDKLKVEIQKVVLNSDKALKLWLNAYEYHRDEEKREALEAVRQNAPPELIEGVFTDLLTRQAEAVLLAASFLRNIAKAPRAGGERAV